MWEIVITFNKTENNKYKTLIICLNIDSTLMLQNCCHLQWKVQSARMTSGVKQRIQDLIP